MSRKQATVEGPEPEKRVVLHIGTGRFAGITQICGLITRDHALGEQFPPALHYGTPERPQMANHCGTHPRYVEYREWIPGPVRQDLDAAQR